MSSGTDLNRRQRLGLREKLAAHGNRSELTQLVVFLGSGQESRAYRWVFGVWFSH